MNTIEQSIIATIRKSIDEMDEVIRRMDDPDDMDLVREIYHGLYSVFELVRSDDNGISQETRDVVRELQSQVTQKLSTAGQKAFSLRTESVTFEIPFPVLENLRHLVCLNKPAEASTVRDPYVSSLDDLVLHVLRSVAEGYNHPGSWQHQTLELMGLLPKETPMDDLLKRPAGKPASE
jgi:hypothetical protein